MSKKMTKVIRAIFMPFTKLSYIIWNRKAEPEIKVTRTHNVVLKKFSIDDYINRKEDERRVLELIGAQKGLAVTGTKDGAIGLPSHDIASTCATLEEWTAKCISSKTQIVSPIEFKSEELKTLVENLLANFEEYTFEERVNFLLSQKQKEINKKFRRIFRSTNTEKSYQEQIREINEEINQEDAEQHDLIRNTYHQKRPKKRLNDYTALYVIFLMLITLGEFPLNITALQNLGEFSNAFVLILSGFLALIMGFSAHAAGHAFFKRHRAEWLTAVILGLVVCLIVSVLRSHMQGSLIMSLMNVLVFSFGCFISYDRARNLAFWNSVRRKKRLQRQKVRKQALIDKVMVEYRADAEKDVREQLDDLRLFIDSGTAALKTIQAYRNNLEKRIDAIHEEGMPIYRNANTLSRLKAGHKPVAIWEQRQVRQLDGNDNHSTGSTFYTYIQGVIILFWIFGLSACGTSEPNEAVILFDVTDPVTINNIEKEKITPYLLEEVLELPDNVLQSQGLNITVSSIGSTSIQYTETAKLEVGGSFLSRTEKTRKTDVGSFKEEVVADIETIAKPSKELDKTVLMQNLCGHLNALATSNAPKKAILIFSDMLENTPQLSFYNYRNNPSQLLDHYETLAAKMDKICPLPALNNITVTIIYLPTEETDGLFQASKTFWSKYLTGYGAEVIFSPNI